MSLRKPPLHDVHEERGAEFTDFGGWDMPVEFDGIQTEHDAVREAVGIFDVSHMSEIEVTGPDATELMERLVCGNVGAMDVGDALYTAILNEDGHIIDDTIVNRPPDADGDPHFVFVPNAGNDELMYERWVDHRDEWDLDATVENRTDDFAMFAIQGPDAEELVDSVTDEPVADLGFFEARYAEIAGVETWVSRTGYTGEDGFETMVPWDEAETVWEAFDCQPCGLGCRDTLRLEAGLLLAGNDFDVEENPRTPFEAGISFAVDLDTEFVGRDALATQDEEGLEEKIVGLKLTERGIPRHGYDIANADGDVIGEVSSGTMSPTFDEPIGMGYVPVEYADPGTEVQVVIRGRNKMARIETLPFLGQDE
ncbi:MAG: glycine cleavage system aminomethyltransferase GcvT [Halobacteriales archaeon]